MTACSICGGRAFGHHNVLWPSLIAEWELRPEEAEYIDRQQGTHCVNCRANLRIIVLGQAIQDVLQTSLPLRDYAAAAQSSASRILDINGCEALSAALTPLPGYLRADFPDLDMCRMPYPDGSFDLVIHSDTLEHVPDPLRGLEECRRVLKPGGRLCFTIPIVVGRTTRNRGNLPKSYHGAADQLADDYLVHTEFGADAWTLPMQAGFDNVALKQLQYPTAHAVTAWRNPVPPPRLTIYCVAYRRYDKLPVLVHSLMCQTCRDFRLVVIHDGEDAAMRALLAGFKNSFPDRFDFFFTERRFNDYGHSLRALAIEQCTSAFIMLTNDDNYYVPEFLEKMFDKIDSEDLDFVLCDMVHSHDRPGGRPQGSYNGFVTQPWKYNVDIGCFIVKTGLAKAVGFRDRTHDGDGTFVDDIMAGGGRAVRWGKVDEILFVHN